MTDHKKDDIIEVVPEKAHRKTFKEYYADPEYKKRHNAHMLAKIKCQACDVMVSRCNMSKHNATKKHKQIEAAKKSVLPNVEEIQKALENAMKLLVEKSKKQTLKI